MKLSVLVLIFAFAMHCYAQDITVHVIDDRTQKPLKGISLLLWKDCESPNRPKALVQKTDATGTTVFHSVSLASEPLCIYPFSVVYGSAPAWTFTYVFVAPEQAKQFDKVPNATITLLPADVTFRVQKRSFGEQLQFLFQGP